MVVRPPHEFSLVLGGPLYQLYLRARMVRPPLELAARRVLGIPLVAWLPLLVLALAEGHAFGGTLRVPFAWDLEAHVRYLLALPLLIAAELTAHRQIRPLVEEFVSRDIVPPEARGRFEAIVASAMRLRNSLAVELALIAFAYTAMHLVWRSQIALHTPTWFASEVTPTMRLSWAGLWYTWVSIPLFQFILLRWYFRLFVWFGFLWRVSRLPLRLLPTHPDRAGGLGFLAESVRAFGLVVLAQATLLSGVIGNHILHDGAALPEFTAEIAAVTMVIVVVVLAPLLVFSPRLVELKRTGMREYGALASRYVSEFDAKWLRGGAGTREPLVGSADIQSLADLANSFGVVEGMRSIPLDRTTIIQVLALALVPVAPLALTMVPLDELVKKLLAVLL